MVRGRKPTNPPRIAEDEGLRPGATLAERWAHRDHRYAIHPQSYTLSDVRAIRAYRRGEAEDASDAALARFADRWEPPANWRHRE